MSEVSATELATRIAIDATELEHRLQAARDALEQTDARIKEAFFAGWLGGKSAHWVYKGQADRAYEKFLSESAGDCDEAVAVGPNATGANALIVPDTDT